MTSLLARQGISGVHGGLAAQKPFLMPCPPLTSIAWDFLLCVAHRAPNLPIRRVRSLRTVV